MVFDPPPVDRLPNQNRLLAKMSYNVWISKENIEEKWEEKW